MEKRSISIGIIAHNEESNILTVLNSILLQKLEHFQIVEIIVVSSSSDKTNQIVSSMSSKYPQINLIIEPNRQGKYRAINLFIQKTRSNILVMISADTMPKHDSIEQLCLPLLCKDVGLSGAQVIPIRTNTNFMHSVTRLQWELHHRISLTNPKFGEMIAFKKLFLQIPKTIVDEEEIANQVKSLGFRRIYAPKAIVYNSCPTSIVELFQQRRRIYSGHLYLKKRTSYKVPTLNNWFVLKVFIKNISFKNIITDLLGVSIEAISRICGALDFLIGHKDHHIWKTAKTAKHNLQGHQ